MCFGELDATAYSAIIDPASIIGPCPNDWMKGTTYDGGDLVAVTKLEYPMHKVAYRCLEWPLSQHCGQFSPDDALGGSLGEILVTLLPMYLEPAVAFLSPTRRLLSHYSHAQDG